MEHTDKILSEIILKLSDFFGVAAEVIKENFMTYVLMYGKYEVIKDLPVNFILSIFLVVFLLLLLILFTTALGEDKSTLVKMYKPFLYVASVIVVILTFWSLIVHLINPEIDSLVRVYNLIK